MLGYADNIKFFLFSNELGLKEIPPYKDYNQGNGDIYDRDKDGKYFKVKKGNRVELYREAYEYLRKINVLYGVTPDVRLIREEKDALKPSEDWITVSNVGVDLFTLDFDDTQDIVSAEVITGGIIETIEARFSDDYDILPDETLEGVQLSPLKTVQVRLDPRQILKRSRLYVEDGTIVTAKEVGNDGLNAKAIPFQEDYNSDKFNIKNVLGSNLNAVNGNYAKVTGANAGNIFYLNADRDHQLILNGKVKTTITDSAFAGSFYLDLVKYDGGDDLNFKEVVLRLDSLNPSVVGDIAEYTFTDYAITVFAGESLAITTLSDTTDTIKYEVSETELLITEEDLFPVTYTKAIKPFDLIERVLAKITGKEKMLVSSVFGPGGKYENHLLAHGTWLRNMPEVLNPGKDDERKIQASISLETIYNAYSILEPLRYAPRIVGLSEKFEVGVEKETQKNDIRVRIGETRGEFRLTEVQGVKRKVIGDNYYGSIKIGSSKSGNNYGEVNNLYSTCGNATYNTINKKSKSEYTALTDVRTGAEDIELTRQVQYADKPDSDTERDDDWFLIDCKAIGAEYQPLKWDDLFVSKPTGVYSADTNFNWRYTPARLLLGHGWKIKSGFSHVKHKDESIKFISSNCASSLITQVSGKDPLKEGDHIPHSLIEDATVDPVTVEFTHPINQEILTALSDPENLNGLIEFESSDGIEYGRLIKVDTNGAGKWTLIEAKNF